jgi:hypothetical protein
MFVLFYKYDRVTASCGFDTLEYSWVKATIGICTLADYSVAKKCQHLSFPKVTYSLCDRGVRLKNHFLFLVMCHEQSESMNHVSSRPLSSTYIGQENVDGSVLGLVR